MRKGDPARLEGREVRPCPSILSFNFWPSTQIRKQKSYASSPSFRSLGTICSLRNELAYHKAKQTAEAICYAKVKERYAKMVDALTSLEGALKKMSIARAWTESIHNRAALLRNGQLGKCQPTTAADEL